MAATTSRSLLPRLSAPHRAPHALTRLLLCVGVALLLLACDGSARVRSRVAQEEPASPTPTVVAVTVDATAASHTVSRQLLGQGLWYAGQAYALDAETQETLPAALAAFARLQSGLIGHYPGIGATTHDFHWQNLIGPLAERTDPTPREKTYDLERHLEFGPDEYGRLLMAYRALTGQAVEGSIQVNIVNGTAEEAADWVEYMNAPADGSNPGGGVDWAAVRAANGHTEPYGIRYWELGNEPHFTAANIGHLTAEEYVARIRRFVPLMKERDPSIRVMAYVNPFPIGDRTVIGQATADIQVTEDITWTQLVIQETGDLLDHLFFHWYGGWNDNVHEYETFATSMYTGLVPLLDRLGRDVENFAPSAAARQRLRQVMIPEWNVYGGWVKPVARGTALQGAIAYARTLHLFASRPEVIAAQHYGLFTPFPEPALRLGLLLDGREGYFVFRGQADGSALMETALGPVVQLWARAFGEQLFVTQVQGAPHFANGISALDATALGARSADGSRLQLILTNASPQPVTVAVTLVDFLPQPQALRLSVTGPTLDANNSWEEPTLIQLVEEPIQVASAFELQLPPYAVQAVLMEAQP